MIGKLTTERIMEFTKISLTDFRIHCHAHFASVEKGDLTLHITRHGKIVLELQPPSPDPRSRTTQSSHP